VDELTREFLIECNELLDQADQALVGLEKDPGSKDLLNLVFRAVHTIKGTSGTLGFPRLERVSHSGENLFSLLRKGTIGLNSEMTTALLVSLDMLRRQLASIEATGTESDADAEIATLTAALNRFIPVSAPAQTPESVSVLTIAEAQSEACEPVAASPAATADFRDPTPEEVNFVVNERVALARSTIADAQAAGKLEEIFQGDAHPAKLSVSNSAIRVDVLLLDKLMDLVGELVLSRNQLLQMTTRINDNHFARTVVRLKTLTSELQEGITKTRMQPIDTVWKKLPRMVRDVAASCGKRVRIEMVGSQTELDKTLLEAVNDPLMHIIRNSIDHGIGSAEERAHLCKPVEGLITLRAFHEGGQVNIEISDDGRGIQLERVKQRALADGFVTASQVAAMTEQEVLKLVFKPGLSTAEQVTNVSGRGVGMDVVRTNIESIGGTVDLTSEQGKGTKVTIKIPLTLAIIPALIVASGDERFAIPQVCLIELVRLEEGAASARIERIHGQPVFRLRGHLLPLVELNHELELERSSPDGSISIIVLQTDGHQFGLVVDQIYDTEEIVVKPLGAQIKSNHCFSGATILGDGHVALILDVCGIGKQGGMDASEPKQSSNQNAVAHQNAKNDSHSWLLFRVGETGRMALPLSEVSRLEKINVNRVEHSGDSQVYQYRGQVMPLINVAEFLGRKNIRAEEEKLEVIVYPHAGRNLGLVVDQILDIVEGHSLLEEKNTRHGISGCAVIQDRVTDLLDVKAVLMTVEFGREQIEEVCA
jgi:two-component system chemotaxis sensor kinase CheA